MKIFKENTQSLFPRPVLLQGRPHLSLAVLLFFDLTAPAGPEALLSEQDLWKTVPEALGPKPSLDQGMPKQRGEFLVTGSCCAPRGTTLQGAEVKIRVGRLEKRLAVFGERFWTPQGGITPPKAFAEVPLTWENAFGGPNVPENPVGKGAVEVDAGDGRALRPLPQVENPRTLVGAPTDTPPPAGLAPLDQTWPQRNMQSGTFDERWKRERWPGLPDDYDYGFFNCAPKDQQLDGFFRGDEEVGVIGMHPDYTSLQTALPGIRPRCFVTLRQGFKRFADPNAFEQVFQETPLRPETLWLFPTLLRGVLLYRGVTPVADEDYGDVVRIFLANETMESAPLSIEHYQDAQRKALDRGVPIDMAPFEAAQARIAQAVLKLKNAPKEMARARDAALGRLPVMPRAPEELAQQFHGVMADRLKTLDSMETMAARMNERWGHIARVDTSSFASLRQRIADLGTTLDSSVGKVKALQQKGAAKKAELLAASKKTLAKHLTPEQIATSGLDPEGFFKKEVAPWQEQAFAFAVQCRRNLEQDAELQALLQRFGLSRKTIARSWLGWNPTPLRVAAADWGLPGPDPLELPAGLVLPWFDGPACARLSIRPAAAENRQEDLSSLGKDVAVMGSTIAPRLLPAPVAGAPVLVVRAEYQALLLEQEVGDCCTVLALPNPKMKLGAEEDAALKDAPHVFVVLPSGTTEDGALWGIWRKPLPMARPLPLPRGETLFSARLAGVDLRKYVLDALPPDFARKHALAPELPEPGKAPQRGGGFELPFPTLDIGGMVSSLMQEIKAVHQPKFDALQAAKGKLLEDARARFASKGLDLEQSLAAAKNAPVQSPLEKGAAMADQMLAKGKQYAAAGRITPAQYELLRSQAEQVRDISRSAQERSDSLHTQYAAMKERSDSLKASANAKTLPGPAGEEMAGLGLSFEEAAPILTREQFLERYQSGRSFSRKTVKNVDCSGLELPGVDLRFTILDGVKFTEANLTGARFENAMVQNSDCTKACLDGATLQGALFAKVVFAEASLAKVSCRRAVFREADFTKADLSGAVMRLVQADKCKFIESNLADADLSLMVFAGCDLSKAFFRNATLRKVVFRACQCDDADFAGATLPQSAFQGSRGERVSFARANLDQGRIISQSAFPGLDLRKASLRRFFCRDSDLRDADFSQANLDTAAFEGCILHRARLDRVSAKQARFTKCDLEAASMRAVNLAMGSLRMSRLVQADLSGANLFGVDCYKIVVGKTNLHQAVLTRTLLKDIMELPA